MQLKVKHHCLNVVYMTKPGCLINEVMLAAEEKMEEELRNQKS